MSGRASQHKNRAAALKMLKAGFMKLSKIRSGKRSISCIVQKGNRMGFSD